MGKPKQPSKPPHPLSVPYPPHTFETYTKPERWNLSAFTAMAPMVGNGDVKLRRYRVRIEAVEESNETLLERLAELWQTSEPNHHNTGPMHAAAVALGASKEWRDTHLRHELHGIKSDDPRKRW